MAENFDYLIAEKEAELSPFLSRMEQVRMQFAYYAARFAAKWYQDTAKEYVTKYPEITLGLKKEKIGVMKQDVNRLTADSEKIVKEALVQPTVWWDMQPVLHDDFSQYEQLGNDQVGNKYPEKVDKPVRQALGELGEVLENFGFKVTINPLMRLNFPEFWFYYPNGKDGEVKPFYPHLLDWSDEMEYTLGIYSSLFKKAVVIYNDIQKLKEERKKQQASERWDSM